MAIKDDRGHTYYVGPSGQLVVIKDTDVQKHKAKAGWREATHEDIDAKVASEAARKASALPTE